MRNLKADFKQAVAGKYNPANSFIKPEMVVIPEMFYSFTINPAEQPIREHPIGVKNWFNEQVKFFEELPYCEFELMLEISSKGRLHFHGVVRIIDVANFYYRTVPALMRHGMCEMDTISDTDVWTDYCEKQQAFIQPWLKRELYGEFNPIVQELENYNKRIIIRTIDERVA